MEVPRLEGESELQLQPAPEPQQHWILATSVTNVTACGNTGSLTHSVRPGIDTASSWTLCQVLNPLNHNGNSKGEIFFFFFFLAIPGPSQTRDQTHATSVTGAVAMTMPGP